MSAYGLWLMLGAWTAPASAGEALVRNDAHTDGDAAYFMGGFIEGECWGSVFVPEPGTGPFSIKHIDALVGGTSTTKIFIVEFYEVSIDDFDDRSLLATSAVTMTGSSTSMNRIDVASLEAGMDLHVFDGTIPMVAICHEEHDGYPSIARDETMAFPDRNYLYASVFPSVFPMAWHLSEGFLLTGDWIMRACVEGAGFGGDCADDSLPEPDLDLGGLNYRDIRSLYTKVSGN